MRCSRGKKKEKAAAAAAYSNTILPQETRKISVNKLMLHIKQPEKEEQAKPKVSRRKEIIKIGGEINEREAKKTKQKSVKLKVGSVRK